MRLILHSLLGVLLGSVFMVGFPAFAQTPDGETPANEGVCDGLVGSTPGLYGLCVAFCEAQDAEATFDVATGEVTFSPDSKPSNPKLLEIYNKKMALGDPPMPCVNVVDAACPCWSDSELDGIADATASCFAIPGIGDVLTGSDAVTGLSEIAYFSEFNGGGGGQCVATFSDHVNNTRIFRSQNVSEGDATQACIESIAAECMDRGL